MFSLNPKLYTDKYVGIIINSILLVIIIFWVISSKLKTKSYVFEFNDLKKISIIKNAEVNRLPSNIYAYGSKQLAGEYKEEIGLRIAVLFGSMVTLNCLLNR